MPVPPPVRRVLRFWEWPFLALLGWWMWKLRMGSYALNVTEDRVYYMGTDPYFHLRALLVSLENFPRALRWDPWTFFPRGTFTGQFGTLFDQVLAAVVLVLTRGEPTRQFAERALAVYPAVLGGLCIVPFYFVARRLFGNPGAAYASVLLALLPGSFFTRSVAAYGDHHVAETLTSTLAVLGVLVAVERARAAEATLVAWRDAPRRDLLALAGWAALGALALAVYFWTWPPAMLFVAVLAGALMLLVGLDHARGRTSRGTGFASAVVFGLALLLVLPLRETGGFEVTWYSWTQPLSLLVPALAIPAAAFASEHLRRRLPSYTYLLALLAFGGLVTALLAVAAPEFFRVVLGGFEWVTGIGYAGGGRTIAEARATSHADLYREYGPLLYGAFAGLLLVAGSVVRDPRPGNVTLLVWSAFMLVAALAQIRFNYYFAVNVALLNGFVLASVAKLVRWDAAWRAWADPPPAAKGRKAAAAVRLSWKQPVAVGAVALLVLPGNVFLYENADTCGGGAPYRPARHVAQCMGADRDIQYWTDGLLWLRDHTPDPGFDVTALPDKDTFRYPPQAYGVLSWWDYGHWEEVLGERPPVANPFQQAAPFASRWFTAQDEAAAETMLEEWSPDHPVRYVLIDDASATTKFYAITVWAGFTEYGGQSAKRKLPDGRDVDLPVTGEPYARTMMSRLYRDDAEALDHYRLVHEERMTSLVGNIVDARNGRIVAFQDILQWGSPEQMGRDYGSLNYRSRDFVCEGPVDARDVCTSGRYAYDLEVHSALKIFEHVRGARLVGTGHPGERVEAILELTATNTGRVLDVSKTTTVGPDGAWTVVVAYPTTGFLGVDAGGTDSDVVPKGEWLVGVGGTPERARVVLGAHVSETDVLEGRTVEAR